MTDIKQVQSSFARCDTAIDNISKQMPHTAKEQVTLTRLQLHITPLISAYFNEGLKPFAINDTTWMALMVIYARQEKSVSPSEISSALAFSRTNATRVVDEIVNKHWVMRIGSANDRRKTELHLTQAGISFIESVLPFQRQRLSALWADFSQEEQQLFETLLRKFLAKLDAETLG